MFKVKEELKTNGITLKGNAIDVLVYLEREQERCGKITVSQYIRQRRLENGISKQLGVNDIRSGYNNGAQR